MAADRAIGSPSERIYTENVSCGLEVVTAVHGARILRLAFRYEQRERVVEAVTAATGATYRVEPSGNVVIEGEVTAAASQPNGDLSTVTCSSRRTAYGKQMGEVVAFRLVA